MPVSGFSRVYNATECSSGVIYRCHGRFGEVYRECKMESHSDGESYVDQVCSKTVKKAFQWSVLIFGGSVLGVRILGERTKRHV